LNLLKSSDSDHESKEELMDDDDDECKAACGAFEFSQHNQSSSTQVLANADETIDKNIIPEDKSKEIESLQQQHDNIDTFESQEMRLVSRCAMISVAERFIDDVDLGTSAQVQSLLASHKAEQLF
jgi:hypothetical protein